MEEIIEDVDDGPITAAPLQVEEGRGKGKDTGEWYYKVSAVWWVVFLGGLAYLKVAYATTVYTYGKLYSVGPAPRNKEKAMAKTKAGTVILELADYKGVLDKDGALISEVEPLTRSKSGAYSFTAWSRM